MCFYLYRQMSLPVASCPVATIPAFQAPHSDLYGWLHRSSGWNHDRYKILSLANSLHLCLFFFPHWSNDKNCCFNALLFLSRAHTYPHSHPVSGVNLLTTEFSRFWLDAVLLHPPTCESSILLWCSIDFQWLVIKHTHTHLSKGQYAVVYDIIYLNKDL